MGRRRRRRGEAAKQAAWVNNDPLQFYNARAEPLDNHPFRDMWRGTAGFLVCGGPSINHVPYKRLAERGICSLGVNNVSGYVPVSAMTFSDPCSKFHYGVLFDPRIIKFVPKPKLKQKIRLKDPATGKFHSPNMRLRNCPSVFGYERIHEFVAEEFLTTTGATWGNNNKGVQKTKGPKTLNTMLLAVRLMHYLGVRRVYLLGVDFGMQGSERQVGNYAFGQAGSPNGNNNAYRVLSEWFAQLKPIFDADRFEIYNCNPESRLTVFPHVPFDTALEDCRNPVPQEPFDLTEWYEASEDKRKKDSSAFDPDA